MANRIQIYQWREHGDDDDSVEVRLIPDGFPSIDISVIREEYDIEKDEDLAEDEEGAGSIYVNADIEIKDGEVMEYDGHKYRVNITPVHEAMAKDDYIAGVARLKTTEELGGAWFEEDAKFTLDALINQARALVLNAAEFTEEAVTAKAKQFARIWIEESPAVVFGDELDMVWIEEDDRYSAYMAAWRAALGGRWPFALQSGEQDAPMYRTFREVLYAEGARLRTENQ